MNYIAAAHDYRFYKGEFFLRTKSRIYTRYPLNKKRENFEKDIRPILHYHPHSRPNPSDWELVCAR